MVNRRELLGTVSLAGLTGVSMNASVQGAMPDSVHSLSPGARVPAVQFLYECIVTLAPTLEFGRTFEGTRRVIPITGGTFEGPRIRGSVLPGGADWNLARADGGGSVDASYYLRTHDEVLIRITNQGIGGGSPAAPPNQQWCARRRCRAAALSDRSRWRLHPASGRLPARRTRPAGQHHGPAHARSALTGPLGQRCASLADRPGFL